MSLADLVPVALTEVRKRNTEACLRWRSKNLERFNARRREWRAKRRAKGLKVT